MEDEENGVPGLKISSIVTMSGQNTVANTDESSQPSEEGSNSKSNGGENNVSFLIVGLWGIFINFEAIKNNFVKVRELFFC